jgi:ribonuclease BN (tRNA processing enzyme)
VIPRAVLLGLMLLVALIGGATLCARHTVRGAVAAVAALDPRSFPALSLVVVGSGGAHENPERRGPCIALGFGSRIVLVDAGRGAAEGLRAAGIPVDQPDTIYLTSLLPENALGVDDLLLTGWLAPRKKPLRLVGPAGTQEFAASLERAYASGARAVSESLALPPEGARLEALEIGDGFSEERGGITFRAAALPGGPLPALAYRAEAGGHAVVISGTGFGDEAVIALARGASVLVHEALHRPSLDAAIEAGGEDGDRLRREGKLHTPLENAGALASRAGVRTLVLVRLRPPPLFAWQFERAAGRDFTGEVIVASDGEEVTR